MLLVRTDCSQPMQNLQSQGIRSLREKVVLWGLSFSCCLMCLLWWTVLGDFPRLAETMLGLEMLSGRFYRLVLSVMLMKERRDRPLFSVEVKVSSGFLWTCWFGERGSSMVFLRVSPKRSGRPYSCLIVPIYFMIRPASTRWMELLPIIGSPADSSWRKERLPLRLACCSQTRSTAVRQASISPRIPSSLRVAATPCCQLQRCALTTISAGWVTSWRTLLRGSLSRLCLCRDRTAWVQRYGRMEQAGTRSLRPACKQRWGWQAASLILIIKPIIGSTPWSHGSRISE